MVGSGSGFVGADVVDLFLRHKITLAQCAVALRVGAGLGKQRAVADCRALGLRKAGGVIARVKADQYIPLLDMLPFSEVYGDNLPIDSRFDRHALKRFRASNDLEFYRNVARFRLCSDHRHGRGGGLFLCLAVRAGGEGQNGDEDQGKA